MSNLHRVIRQLSSFRLLYDPKRLGFCSSELRLTMNSISVNKIATLLGCMGLLPFMAALLASLRDIAILSMSAQWLFASYSAVILSFLCGSLWGRSLSGDFNFSSGLLMTVSNLVALIAWVSLLISGSQLKSSIGLLGLSYLVVLVCELIATEKLYHNIYFGYLRLRCALTIGVVIMHIFMFYLL